MDFKNISRLLKLDQIADHLIGLIETRLALTKLELKEEVARIGAKIIAVAIATFLFFMFMAFISLSIGVFINRQLSSEYLGFVIVAAFYALVLLILILFKVPGYIQYRLKKNLTSHSTNNPKQNND